MAELAATLVSVRRLLLSVGLGLLLGGATAALIFSFAWFGAAFDRGESDAISNFWLAAMASLLGLELFGWARRAQLLKGLLLRLVGGVLILALPAVLWFENRSADIAPWIADRDFFTLVMLALISGVLAFALSSRARWRGRIAHFPAAAVALWFASDWAVTLGPQFDNWFSDPRIGIATSTLVGVGVLSLASVLTAIDWHIKWRDRAERAELERLERRSNG